MLCVADDKRDILAVLAALSAVKGVIFYNLAVKNHGEVEVVSVFAPGIDRPHCLYQVLGGDSLQLVNIILSYTKLLKQGIGVLNIGLRVCCLKTAALHYGLMEQALGSGHTQELADLPAAA